MHYLPWEAGHRREFLRNFLLQVYYTFVQALPMQVVLGLFSGAAISFQADFGLAFLGNNNQLGKLLVLIVFREFTPLATSLILIARSVTAIASELATNKVQQEVEALQVMGISVYHYLLAPRIAAGAVSLFCMAVTFWGLALWGGWLGANFNGFFPLDQYLNSVSQAIRPADFPFFVVKTALIGAVVTHLGCKRGLSLQAAPFEVPIVTNRAVVDCLTVAIAIHGFLTAAYYVIFGVDL
jgi:phospholipid/cholesterol/gamma-HCH transport system permease protein